MSFSEQEKGRIRHFLGYPSWSSLSNGIQLGFPAGGQPLFLLEQAFNRLLVPGEDAVRVDLCECEAIEHQLRDGRSRLKAQKLGDLVMNPRELEALRAELVYWQRRLADDLGVFANPCSTMNYEGIGGGINARVNG